MKKAAALRLTNPAPATHGDGPVVARRPLGATKGDFLGPAAVTEVLPTGAVRVALRERPGDVLAEMAMALRYDAQPGDLLLVIGRDDEHWVIGVLSGTGKTSLAASGDVAIRALGGQLSLESDQAVRLRAPSVEVHADTLRTVARVAIETLATAFQRVTGLLSVHAGQAHTLVENGSFTQAKTAAIQAEEEVTVNGRQIHLG